MFRIQLLEIHKKWFSHNKFFESLWIFVRKKFHSKNKTLKQAKWFTGLHFQIPIGWFQSTYLYLFSFSNENKGWGLFGNSSMSISSKRSPKNSRKTSENHTHMTSKFNNSFRKEKIDLIFWQFFSLIQINRFFHMILEWEVTWTIPVSFPLLNSPEWFSISFSKINHWQFFFILIFQNVFQKQDYFLQNGWIHWSEKNGAMFVLGGETFQFRKEVRNYFEKLEIEVKNLGISEDGRWMYLEVTFFTKKHHSFVGRGLISLLFHKLMNNYWSNSICFKNFE